MFFKPCVYEPLGRCSAPAFRPSLYDDEATSPFAEVETPQEYYDLLERENRHLYEDASSLYGEDAAKDDILEYILREYS